EIVRRRTRCKEYESTFAAHQVGKRDGVFVRKPDFKNHTAALDYVFAVRKMGRDRILPPQDRLRDPPQDRAFADRTLLHVVHRLFIVSNQGRIATKLRSITRRRFTWFALDFGHDHRAVRTTSTGPASSHSVGR